MILKLLLLSLTAHAADPHFPDLASPALRDHVASFEHEFDTIVTNPTVVRRLGKTPDGFDRYGVCSISGVSAIDPVTLTHGRVFTEFVVWHELGHCTFRLRHINERHSIMRTYIDPTMMHHYSRHRARFIRHFNGLLE